MKTLSHIAYLSLQLSIGITGFAVSERGFVNDKTAKNEAVIVGVLHGLPGGNNNLVNMQAITSNPEYQFHNSVLSEGSAPANAILNQLTDSAARVDDNGTLLFYFGGHGGNQILWVQDRNLKTQELRKAIEKGREQLGPLSRLVMIFDACHAASNIDPLSNLVLNRMTPIEPLTAESIAKEFGGDRGSDYWDKLIVMASSRADELSWVNDKGHMFTVAMRKAFNQSMQDNSTVGEFAKRTADNLSASHAVFKLVPGDLANELMRP